MSEHWKSTPKYWCKHCSCYVRDTKLERQNHEATGKHQGALKRFLRDLHRGHEREEREKERARQEIERLNGVVGTSSSAGSSCAAAAQSGARASESQLKAQREQLAALGVAMPDSFRPEMAIAGEWQVTSTRIIEDGKETKKKPGQQATGDVRKRDEEEKETEDAVENLFKKRRKWGRDTKTLPQEEDAELDALLSSSVLTRKGNATKVKSEDATTRDKVEDEESLSNDSKVKAEDSVVKEEPDTATHGLDSSVKTDAPTGLDQLVKAEEGEPAPTAVVFKKRKAKGGLRQK